MKLQKYSPALGPLGRLTLQERALRPQAGVKPLHKSHSYTSPALGPLGRLTLQERGGRRFCHPFGVHV